MLPKPIYTKAKAFVRQLKAELEAETVGKVGLASVPFEVGRTIERHIESLGVRRPDITDFCERMAKENLLERHPLGGWMVKQPKNAPKCPTRDQVTASLTQTFKTIAQQVSPEEEA